MLALAVPIPYMETAIIPAPLAMQSTPLHCSWTGSSSAKQAAQRQCSNHMRQLKQLMSVESTLRTMFVYLRQISSKPRHSGSWPACCLCTASSTPSDVRSHYGSSRTHTPQNISSAAVPPPMGTGTPGTPRCLASYRRSPRCHRAHSYKESCSPWLRSIESNWSNWHNWQLARQYRWLEFK